MYQQGSIVVLSDDAQRSTKAVHLRVCLLTHKNCVYSMR